jgi:HEAT repeat protein
MGGAIPPLLELAKHESERVRWMVAQGLGNYDGPRAAKALIALSSDMSMRVRDWATFGLGLLWRAGSPAIRRALVSRLRDPGRDVRAEALAGLATLGDRRVVRPLLRILKSGDMGRLEVIAAGRIGDPLLYDALVSASRWWDVDLPVMQRAIEACDPARKRRRGQRASR